MCICMYVYIERSLYGCLAVTKGMRYTYNICQAIGLIWLILFHCHNFKEQPITQKCLLPRPCEEEIWLKLANQNNWIHDSHHYFKDGQRKVGQIWVFLVVFQGTLGEIQYSFSKIFLYFLLWELKCSWWLYSYGEESIWKWI